MHFYCLRNVFNLHYFYIEKNVDIFKFAVCHLILLESDWMWITCLSLKCSGLTKNDKETKILKDPLQ